jgi:hypothetical protein
MAECWVPVVCVLVAVWKKRLVAIVQSVLPLSSLMPADADAAAKKLEILLLEIVLLLLFCAATVVVPEEYMALAGVVVPSRISQLSIVLLSFPVVPEVVLNNITPDVVEELTPVIVEYFIVLFVASLMTLTAEPAVEVLPIVSWDVVPVPPGLPSITM